MKPENKSPWLGELNQKLAPGLRRVLEKMDHHESDNLLSMELVFDLMLANAVQQRTTDIHIEPRADGWRVRFRIDGRLHAVAQLDAARGGQFLRFVHTLARMDPVASFLPQDASLQRKVEGHTLDLRITFAPCYLEREKLSIRLLDPNRVRHKVGDIGLGPSHLAVLKSWLRNICGMCLVSGPTGSGKTTTLYAVIKELDLAHHSLVTVEDPVEYPLDGISQIQIDEPHGLTFPVGLKAMLRLDPDYLLLGEMRDQKSARSAMEAAATGHLLLSTVHAPDAAGVVTMLRSWGVADHQIATLLEIVINQRLIRKLCPKCKRAGELSADDKAWLRNVGLTQPKKMWNARGCGACLHTGYQGRTGVFEIWRRVESDYDLILNHADERALRQQLRQRGIRTVLEDGLAKVGQGVTTLSEIQSVAAQTDFFDRLPVPPKAKSRRPKNSTARKRKARS
jgi:general secretion pathway protein E